MASMYTYSIVMAGTILLLALAGIDIPGTQLILDTVGFGAGGLQNSQLFVLIAGVLSTAALGGAIVIGFFTKTSPEFYVLLSISALLLSLFVGTFVGIINYMNSFSGNEWLYYIALVIYGLLGLGYLITVVQWSRGGSQ